MKDNYRVVKYTYGRDDVLISIEQENDNGDFERVIAFSGATQAEALDKAKTFINEKFNPQVIFSGTKADLLSAASA